MRFEELSENRYIKGPDTVERYLLGLVQEYFKTTNIASTTSREYIIQQAVKRMKEEVSFESIGVLSITLPDGTVKTGNVSISLAELGGEPLIFPKLTAFNVNFGKEANTACEGNDPRLSDARPPKPHEHEIKDVIGLEGILSTLTGKINRVNGLMHDHNNKAILDMLTYSGTNTTIDLTILDTFDVQIQIEIDDINKAIQDYRQEITDTSANIGQTMTDIEQEIADIQNIINNNSDNYLAQANQYTDQEIQKLRQDYANSFNGFVTKDSLSNALLNSISLVGSFDEGLQSMISTGNGTGVRTAEVNLTNDIINELNRRGQTLNNCQIELFVTFKKDGSQVMYPMPYITYDGVTITHTLVGGVVLSSNGEHKLQITYNAFTETFPAELTNAHVVLNLYSKQDVTL